MNSYSSELRVNERGLYDLTIRDGERTIVAVRNIMFDRAVVLLEDYMHTTPRKAE